MVLAERFYTMASLRILLSDSAADIMALPGVTSAAPVELGITEPYSVSLESGPTALRRIPWPRYHRRQDAAGRRRSWAAI